MLFPNSTVRLMDTLRSMWPIGSVFISVVDTDPAILIGIGTWEAIGAGRVLVGQDTGDSDFNVLEETGGAKEVTLTEAQMPAHTHTQNPHSHVENSNNTSTGALRGWGAPDTSTNSSTPTGYSTANATAVNQNTGGGQAHSNVQPYLVCKFWRRVS